MILRLIIDPPAPGAWNMAVDEALLLTTTEKEIATLRFYAWSEPTLSIGYFQKYQDRQGHRASADLPLVRRSTGGGALIHHHELTYSFVASAAAPWGGKIAALYDQFHRALIQTLHEGGIAASLCQPSENEAGEAPFLCFQRRSAGDVLLDSAKIAGSAQRRRKGAVLQHGGLLMKRSPFAPELPGIEDLAGMPIDFRQICRRWQSALADKWGIRPCLGSLTHIEEGLADQIREDTFAAKSWTCKR